MLCLAWLKQKKKRAHRKRKKACMKSGLALNKQESEFMLGSLKERISSLQFDLGYFSRCPRSCCLKGVFSPTKTHPKLILKSLTKYPGCTKKRCPLKHWAEPSPPKKSFSAYRTSSSSAHSSTCKVPSG